MKTILLSFILLFAAGVADAKPRTARKAGRGGKAALAECLAKKGYKLYVAWWCPSCNEQKALFGSAAAKLPTVECSTPGKHDSLPECEAANIRVIPTWTGPGDVFVEGIRTLEQLSKLSGCPL